MSCVKMGGGNGGIPPSPPPCVGGRHPLAVGPAIPPGMGVVEGSMLVVGPPNAAAPLTLLLCRVNPSGAGKDGPHPFYSALCVREEER